ncbi:hypothetical protein [Actinocrinis sp.]|uniref:hypothetical protein n=1 Tax=Actinocrinis sp. TaxID=1920516 RepID=UPI002D4005D5|nr:hypothetical protein [Actinocrinis sp.]HZP53281.1 hypothetical protein [Actinocrinis sp.]
MELRSSIPAAALDERDDEPRPGDGEFDWNDDLWGGARRDPVLHGRLRAGGMLSASP